MGSQEAALTLLPPWPVPSEECPTWDPGPHTEGALLCLQPLPFLCCYRTGAPSGGTLGMDQCMLREEQLAQPGASVESRPQINGAILTWGRMPDCGIHLKQVVLALCTSVSPSRTPKSPDTPPSVCPAPASTGWMGHLWGGGCPGLSLASTALQRSTDGCRMPSRGLARMLSAESMPWPTLLW